MIKRELVRVLDVIDTNAAVRELLASTDNPRHQLMLERYDRHRNLEIAGRYKEIFTPELTVAEPVYHFNAHGMSVTLAGRAAVEGIYQMWTQTNQCIFYAEDEEVAVSDHHVISAGILYQQTLGLALIQNGIDVDDENAMYLYKGFHYMIWPYDEECRLVGEDVWEPDPSTSEIIKLDPDEVVTADGAGVQLASLLKDS